MGDSRSSTPREVMEAVCCGSVVAHTIDVERAKIVEESKPQLTRTRLQATAIKSAGERRNTDFGEDDIELCGIR